MGVFEVEESYFDDLASFNNELAEIDTADFDHDLYVIVGFSNLSDLEFHTLLERRGYSISDLGAVKKIRRTYRSNSGDEDEIAAEYYLHYDESTGVILSSTL